MLDRIGAGVFIQLCLALCLCAIGVAQDGAAPQTPETDEMLMEEEAREHFRIGKTLLDAGRFEQAASEFEQAYKLSNRPELLYNIYIARRDAANTAGAVEALRGYLDKVPDAPDRINLKARLKSLEEALQRQKAQEEAKAAAEAEAQAQAAAAQQASTEQVPQTRTETVRSKVPWYLLGGGGALIVGGVVTGLLQMSAESELEDNCSGFVCASDQSDNVDSAQNLALVTDILWISGVAVAGTGVVLALTGVLDSEREVPVTAGCSPGQCGVVFRGSF